MHRRTAVRPADALARLPILLPLLLATLACGPAASQSAGGGPLPDCEWCGFSTIRPAQYPTDNAPPAHVHVTVEEPGREEYWIDSFEFSDDPKVTPQYRRSRAGRGGSGIIELRWEEGAEGEEGVWVGERDIVLIELSRRAR